MRVLTIAWIFLLFGLLPSGASSEELLVSTGRLERMESSGTCSATLISVDLVVTAAHCVGLQKDLEGDFPRLFYRPAAPNFAAPIAVVAGAQHPLYTPGRDDARWRFPFDLAVLRLARAIPETSNPSLRLGPPPVSGERLTLFTWRSDPNEPVVRSCQVLPGSANLVTLGCRVRGGESGGAVVRLKDTGAEIVAVLTSRARIGDLDIAQASHLEGRVTPMLRLLEANEEGG